MQPALTCPNCQNDEGEKILGYEIREVYDGTLFWVCLACGGAWPRDFGPIRRTELSKRHAAWYNNRSARRVEP